MKKFHTFWKNSFLSRQSRQPRQRPRRYWVCEKFYLGNYLGNSKILSRQVKKAIDGTHTVWLKHTHQKGKNKL